MSWQADWQAFWAGDWFGPVEQVEGAISGVATVSVNAAGSLSFVRVEEGGFRPVGGIAWWFKEREPVVPDEEREAMQPVQAQGIALETAARRATLRLLAPRKPEAQAFDLDSAVREEVARAMQSWNLEARAWHEEQARRMAREYAAHLERVRLEDEFFLMAA